MQRHGGNMRPTRGATVLFWVWTLIISVVLFSLMIYFGVLESVGNALFELLKDILRYLLD
jgi:hypothetical protein